MPKLIERTGKESIALMETVVQVVRGDTLIAGNKPCIFCNKVDKQQIFCVTAGKKYDGILLRGFPVCYEHLDKINALLSGEFDIDKIELEKYRKQVGRTVRLRG